MPHRYSTPPSRGRTASKPGTPVGQVQSLTRGLSILEALAETEGGLTLTDLAHRVQLPASTAHRLLSTLQRMGYVYQAGEDRKSTRLNSSHPSISYAVFCL